MALCGGDVIMAMVIAATTRDMSRDQWLEERRKGIGGSDASAVAGLSRYRTPIQVYMEKLGLIDPPEENEAMYWGKKLEDLVAEEFSHRTGLKVRRRNAILQHPEYPFMLANVDRFIVGKDEGLECKTTSAYKADEWAGDGIPWEYAIQCHHYMAVTGFGAWWIAVLIGGNRFVCKRIERDEEIIANLIKIESDFWNNHVLKQIPPEPDGTTASSELMKRIYPDSNGREVDLPSAVEHWIEQYEQAAEEEKAAAMRKEEAANNIKMLLGEYEVGLYRDWRITWRKVSSSRLDTKRLKTEMPDIYTKYANQTSVRRFEIRRMED
jgi:putative phage-type endonuclease